MSRIEALERIAYGVQCDGTGCEVLISVRNAASMPAGFYIDVVRVTEELNRYVNPVQLFFHDKECMLNELKWGLSSITSKSIGKQEQ